MLVDVYDVRTADRSEVVVEFVQVRAQRSKMRNGKKPRKKTIVVVEDAVALTFDSSSNNFIARIPRFAYMKTVQIRLPRLDFICLNNHPLFFITTTDKSETQTIQSTNQLHIHDLGPANSRVRLPALD